MNVVYYYMSWTVPKEKGHVNAVTNWH